MTTTFYAFSYLKSDEDDPDKTPTIAVCLDQDFQEVHVSVNQGFVQEIIDHEKLGKEIAITAKTLENGQLVATKVEKNADI